jgi:outer membrane protein with beta-barrel domain
LKYLHKCFIEGVPMKKSVLLVLLLVFVSIVFLGAQISGGLKIAGGMSSYSGDDWKNVIASNIDLENSLGFSYGGGLFLNIAFTENLSIQPEVLYSSLTGGGRYPAYEYDFEYREHVIEAPVYLQIGLPIGKGKFLIMGGPDFFYTFGDIKLKDSDGSVDSWPASEDYDSLFRMGFAAGIGYTINKIQLAAVYKRALTSVSDTFDLQNQNISFELGLLF